MQIIKTFDYTNKYGEELNISLAEHADTYNIIVWRKALGFRCPRIDCFVAQTNLSLAEGLREFKDYCESDK